MKCPFHVPERHVKITIQLFAVIIVLMTSMTASSMEHTLVSGVAVLAVVEAARNVGSFPAYLPHQDCPWDQSCCCLCGGGLENQDGNPCGCMHPEMLFSYLLLNYKYERNLCHEQGIRPSNVRNRCPFSIPAGSRVKEELPLLSS